MAFGTVLSLAGDELSAPLGKAISEGLITPKQLAMSTGPMGCSCGAGDPARLLPGRSVGRRSAQDVERERRGAAELALTGVQMVPMAIGCKRP